MKQLAVLAMVGCLASLRAGTVAFYPLADATEGAEISSEEMVNAAEGGTQFAVSTAKAGVGTLPTVSDDVPGTYIYDTVDCSHLVVARPKSISIARPESTANGNGATVVLTNLGKAISELDSFTIECFVKADLVSGNTWRNVFWFKSAQNMKCGPQAYVDSFGIQNLAIQNKGGDMTYATSKTIGKWHHIAITYTKDEACTNSSVKLNRAYLWVDHAASGSVYYTNDVVNAGNFILGGSASTSENFYGKICALRITDRVLDMSAFMRASEYPGDEGDLLAFYPFKDGAVGDAVTTVSNTVNALNLLGTASSNLDANSAAPAFAEGPGAFLYSTTTGGVLVCEAPGSVLFSGSDSSKTYGGRISFADMSTQLSYLDDFTVEFFAKFEGTQTWSTLLEYNAGMDSKIANMSATTIVFQDKTKGTGVNIAASRYANYNDGLWHHLAFSYSKSDNKTTFYCDYMKAGSNYSVTNSLRTTSVKLAIGGHMSNNGEYFHGRIAALRVTKRVLNAEDFLGVLDAKRPEITSEFEKNVIYHWPLDGEDGSQILVANAEPFNSARYQGAGSGVSGGHAPLYSTSAIHPTRVRIWNGERFLTRKNSACAEFFGKRTSEDGAWTGSLLQETSLPASEHPRSFTYEMFVKARNAIENNELLMGKGKSDNDYTWKISTSSAYGLGLEFEAVTNGVSYFINSSLLPKKADFTPNVWHHLAITYDHDSSPRRLRVYFDYVNTCDYEFPEGGELKENTGYLFRHGRYCNTHGFNGWMDEIRLYRGVLEPDKFLRLQSEAGTMMIIR